MPDQIAAEIHAEERAAALERLAEALHRAETAENKQTTKNIAMATAIVVIALALVAVVVVVLGNRSLIHRLDEATGERAQAAQQAVIDGIKCDNRQALGEALASIGIDPPPLKPGCPPYTVTVAPRADQGDTAPRTVTATPTGATGSTAPDGTRVVVVSAPAPSEPSQSAAPPPNPQPQPEPTPEPSPEPEPDPEPCALGVAILGCVVHAGPNASPLLDLPVV